MVKKNKRSKRKPLKGLLAFLLFILVVFLLVRPIFTIGYKKLATTRPKMTTYKNVIRGQGYTILNQSQFYAKNDGIVVYGAQEGERVPVDYEIATVNFQDDFSSQKDDLIRIQAAIDYKSNKRSSEKDNYQETPEIRNTIEKIQSSIKDNDFQAMISDINNLDLITPHNVNISELSELLNEPLESLEEKKEDLSKALSQTRSRYVSTFPGVISYIFPAGKSLNYDGSFDKFTLSYLDQLHFSPIQQSGVKVKKDKPIFRIIDNLQWYIAVSVHNNSKLKDLEIGQEVSLVLNKKEAIKGVIREIKEGQAKEGVIIIAMEEGFEQNYTKAKQNAEIILKQEDAYTVPAKAIVEQKKQTGVYVQDIHNLVRFVPVKIIAQNEDWVYVKKGDMKNKITIGEKNQHKQVQTITYEDNIVLDPTSVQEKQLIN